MAELPRRNPTLAGFFSLGLFLGCVGRRTAERAGGEPEPSKGALGLAMLFVSLGSIPAMFLLAAPAVDRFGARAVRDRVRRLRDRDDAPGPDDDTADADSHADLRGIGTGLVDVAINANVGGSRARPERA